MATDIDKAKAALDALQQEKLKQQQRLQLVAETKKSIDKVIAQRSHSL